MRNILVTGGAGFIGSNFIRYMLKKYDYRIINIDLLTYAGNLENLAEVESHPKYTFVQGDIRDKALIDQLFREYKIDTVVNFAAESHVDRSIEDPEVFLTTNILGTQNLLDVAKKYWKINKEDANYKASTSTNKYLQVSTDEVYGTLGEKGLFTENTNLAPNSPYSASKASADMIVRAYHETYGLPVNITRCSNNYGPCQHTEKLIPLLISRCMTNSKLPIYGDGLQIRDWLYVEDHCSAIDAVLHKGKIGEVYNVGGNNEKTNMEIAKYIIKEMNVSETLISHVEDRLGHDRRYAIDNTKIKTQLGWEPAYSFEEGMKQTIMWYRDKLRLKRSDI